MDLDMLLMRIEKLKPVLRDKYGVKEIAIFGSTVRKEAKKRSDIDILIDFDNPEKITLLDFIEIKNLMSKELGKKVDLVMKSGLKPSLKNQIFSEALFV